MKGAGVGGRVDLLAAPRIVRGRPSQVKGASRRFASRFAAP
jgi:hypothetical protein